MKLEGLNITHIVITRSWCAKLQKYYTWLPPGCVQKQEIVAKTSTTRNARLLYIPYLLPPLSLRPNVRVSVGPIL